MEVSFISSFKRAFKKRIQGNIDLETRFWEKLEKFTIDQKVMSQTSPFKGMKKNQIQYFKPYASPGGTDN